VLKIVNSELLLRTERLIMLSCFLEIRGVG
jgi:hypothetical protein